jgi:hypothetical protein
MTATPAEHGPDWAVAAPALCNLNVSLIALPASCITATTDAFILPVPYMIHQTASPTLWLQRTITTTRTPETDLVLTSGAVVDGKPDQSTRVGCARTSQCQDRVLTGRGVCLFTCVEIEHSSMSNSGDISIKNTRSIRVSDPRTATDVTSASPLMPAAQNAHPLNQPLVHSDDYRSGTHNQYVGRSAVFPSGPSCIVTPCISVG